MLDDLRRAWEEAVRNFRRELHGSEAEPALEGGSAEDALARARRELADVSGELERCRQRLSAERADLEACRRRGEMARRIGDGVTARIAGRFASRHHEWVALLTRKVEVLEAEQLLRAQDVRELESLAAAREEMERKARSTARSAPGDTVGAAPDPLEDPVEAAFRDLEEQVRERVAEERAADLKRRR